MISRPNGANQFSLGQRPRNSGFPIIGAEGLLSGEGDRKETTLDRHSLGSNGPSPPLDTPDIIETVMRVLCDAKTNKPLDRHHLAMVYIQKYRLEHGGDWPTSGRVQQAARVGRTTAHRALVQLGKPKQRAN